MTVEYVGDRQISPEEIRAYRDILGITQRDLAGQLGSTWQTVSNWERGATRPSGMAARQLRTMIDEEERRGEECVEGEDKENFLPS